MVFCCSVTGCSNSSCTTKTHCLPKDPEIRRRWCQALNRYDLLDVTDKKRYNFRVCSVHFEEDAKFLMNRNRTDLKYDAVPTLYLGGNTFATPTTSPASTSFHEGNINSGLTTPSTSAAFDTIYCAPSTSAGSAAVDEAPCEEERATTEVSSLHKTLSTLGSGNFDCSGLIWVLGIFIVAPCEDVRATRVLQSPSLLVS